MIRRIAVLTSGDNTPGMNAAIRSVTRTAIDHGWDVLGIRDGYAGLMAGDFVPLTVRKVGGIIQRGGTVLRSFESAEFRSESGRNIALNHLTEHEVDALVVIGGASALSDAERLSQLGFPVNGVAASIENDVAGSALSIGADTALNIALEAIDRLKITSEATDFAFLVEVAGQRCGYLALMAGIGGGAEAVVIPEIETSPEQVAEAIQAAHRSGKSHAVVVVAEGARCNVDVLANYLMKADMIRLRLHTTRLCNIQHGGKPSAFDRLLGTFLGACAADALARGEYGVLAGWVAGSALVTPFAEAISKTRDLDSKLMNLSNVLAL